MTILATTDFSPAAREAAAAAAAIAARLGEPLLLVHAGGLAAGAPPAEARPLQQRLDAEAASLARPGAAVQTSLLEGNPVAAILACVDRIRPRLVAAAAVSSEKRRKLGRVAEAIAQGSSRPLLIVRGAAPFLEWTGGARPLRVLVGDDFSAFTEPAYHFIRELRAAGPCEVTVAHLYSPLAEHGRAGLLGRGGEPAQVERRIEEDLKARVEALGEPGAQVRTAASYGRMADPLVALAAVEQADLLVLGTHQRKRLERVWQGSVSHLALELAPMAVASVPFDEERDVGTVAVPPVRRVLACTDFSRLGDSAIGHACSILGGGGEVIALHVIPVWPPLPATAAAEDAAKLVTAEERMAALARLQALVPHDAAARGITFRTEVAAGGRVAPVICRIAERENVDLVCLSSHGRGGVTRAVLGSVAGGVIAQTRRPVLVARPRAT
jgi:nucleotide-binding universal stress UspA family protein